jgi:hypothetical protein
MDEEGELGVSDDLGPSVAVVQLVDCHLSFHEQRHTGDFWARVTGPLGTFVYPLIRKEVLLRLAGGWPVAQRGAHHQARERYAKWQRVTLSDDLLVAMRARGGILELHYLFGDGVPFGGSEKALPTMRRGGPIQRIRDRFAGRRGTWADTLRQ